MKLRAYRIGGGMLLAVITLLFLTNVANAQGKPLTARQLIERIEAKAAGQRPSDTVDTFKAGDPDTRVTGIAVTMMATLDVLQRAAAAGDNLIITHEPTFFDHLDKATDLPLGENDEVLAAKKAFIKEHKLVIWRFHDQWHARTPDGIEDGMKHALGWDKYQDMKLQYLYDLPETNLEKLASSLREKLGTHVMRVIGDPKLVVKKVAVVPGASGFGAETQALEVPGVDVLITGEPREWETVEYVADAVTEGKKKALIILGHIPSEQAGMEECAKWLKTFVAEVPVQFVATKDPFWKYGASPRMLQ